MLPAEQIDSVSILKGTPVTVCTIGDNKYYIGNDGNIYSKINDAFPIYKCNIDNNINLMNLYGNWILVDNSLNIIEGDGRVNINSGWTKI